MMDYKKFKKFGAAVTAAAMFGTLGTGVFAAEDAVDPAEVPSVPVVEAPVVTEAPEVTEAPVVDETPAETEAPEETKAPAESETPAESAAPDVTEAPAETEAPESSEAPAENAEVGLATDTSAPVWDGTNLDGTTGISITEATASVTTEGIYTVNMKYSITGETDQTAQVTMLAYLFENGGAAYVAEANASIPAMEEANIRAIDQTANTGNISFKLAKEGGLPVAADSTLVVKVGSDAASATAAQAIIIDLANAEMVDPTDILYGDVNGDGKVNAKDHADLGNHLAKWEGYLVLANPDAADVNSDTRVNAKDHADLGKHLAKWAGYEELPLK